MLHISSLVKPLPTTPVRGGTAGVCAALSGAQQVPPTPHQTKGSKGLLHSGHRRTDTAVSRVRARLADVLGTSALQWSTDPSPGTFCPKVKFSPVPAKGTTRLRSFTQLPLPGSGSQPAIQHAASPSMHHHPERQIQQTVISSCQGLQQTHGPTEAHRSLLPCQVLQHRHGTTRQAASTQPELILWGSSAPASSKAVTLQWMA